MGNSSSCAPCFSSKERQNAITFIQLFTDPERQRSKEKLCETIFSEGRQFLQAALLADRMKNNRNNNYSTKNISNDDEQDPSGNKNKNNPDDQESSSTTTSIEPIPMDFNFAFETPDDDDSDQEERKKSKNDEDNTIFGRGTSCLMAIALFTNDTVLLHQFLDSGKCTTKMFTKTLRPSALLFPPLEIFDDDDDDDDDDEDVDDDKASDDHQNEEEMTSRSDARHRKNTNVTTSRRRSHLYSPPIDVFEALCMMPELINPNVAEKVRVLLDYIFADPKLHYQFSHLYKCLPPYRAENCNNLLAIALACRPHDLELFKTLLDFFDPLSNFQKVRTIPGAIALTEPDRKFAEMIQQMKKGTNNNNDGEDNENNNNNNENGDADEEFSVLHHICNLSNQIIDQNLNKTDESKSKFLQEYCSRYQISAEEIKNNINNNDNDEAAVAAADGANPNEPLGSSSSPLSEFFKKSLQQNPPKTKTYGINPLMMALRCALPKVTKTLIQFKLGGVIDLMKNTTKKHSSRWGNYSALHFAAEGPGVGRSWSGISYFCPVDDNANDDTEKAINNKKQLEDMVQDNLYLNVKEIVTYCLSLGEEALNNSFFVSGGCSCRGKFIETSGDMKKQKGNTGKTAEIVNGNSIPSNVTPVLLAIMNKNVGALRAFIEMNVPHGYPKNDSADSDDDNDIIEFAEKFGRDVYDMVKTAPLSWVHVK